MNESWIISRLTVLPPVDVTTTLHEPWIAMISLSPRDGVACKVVVDGVACKVVVDGVACKVVVMPTGGGTVSHKPMKHEPSIHEPWATNP